jgi:spore coat protein U-like protein
VKRGGGNHPFSPSVEGKMNSFYSIADLKSGFRKHNKTIYLIAVALILCSTALTFAASNNIINVSATILSNNNCRFRTKAATLAFGNLDPANPVVVNTSTTIDFRCQGAAGTAVFSVSQDGGLNPLGPQNRMKHLTLPGTFIPYTLSLVHVAPPITKNVWYTLTINGTILGPDYQVASGDYQDTVVISIIP